MRSTPNWPLSPRRESELGYCPRLEDLAGRALDLWHVLPASPNSVVRRAHPVAIIVIPDPCTLVPAAIVGRRLTGRCGGGTNSSTTSCPNCTPDKRTTTRMMVRNCSSDRRASHPANHGTTKCPITGIIGFAGGHGQCDATRRYQGQDLVQMRLLQLQSSQESTKPHLPAAKRLAPLFLAMGCCRTNSALASAASERICAA